MACSVTYTLTNSITDPHGGRGNIVGPDTRRNAKATRLESAIQEPEAGGGSYKDWNQGKGGDMISIDAVLVALRRLVRITTHLLDSRNSKPLTSSQENQ
jgi:hypothetical protein